MTRGKIFVEVTGGCFQRAVGVPKGYEIELIDWDKLLGDGADTSRDWARFGAEAQEFIGRKYLSDYQHVLARIRASVVA